VLFFYRCRAKRPIAQQRLANIWMVFPCAKNTQALQQITID
jgi:hypothetical protein